MRKTATLLFLCLVMAVSAQADHYSDTYVIPVVGHVMGANGTMWMSDVSIRNFSTQPLHVAYQRPGVGQQVMRQEHRLGML